MKNFFILIMLVNLSACGFKPLYEKNTSSADNLEYKLSQIKVEVSNNETISKDFLFALKLSLDQFSNKSEKLYLLKLDVKKELTASVIQNDSTATRYNVKTYINYEFYTISPHKLINKSSISMTSGFDTMPLSEYANYVAENSSFKNNIREISDELKKRLCQILLKIKNEN